MYEEYRDRVTGPGKFENESPMAAFLYDLSLDGFADETVGDVQYNGHVSRFGRRCLFEDSNGFVTYKRYETESEAIERASFYEVDPDVLDDDDSVLCVRCNTYLPENWREIDAGELPECLTGYTHDEDNEPGGLLDEVRQAENLIAGR